MEKDRAVVERTLFGGVRQSKLSIADHNNNRLENIGSYRRRCIYVYDKAIYLSKVSLLVFVNFVRYFF